MKRYFTMPKRPRAYTDEGEWEHHERGAPQSCTVYEPEDENVFSGLLSPEGEPLYRRARAPIGFLRRDE